MKATCPDFNYYKYLSTYCNYSESYRRTVL